MTLCVDAPSLLGGKGKKPRRQKIQGCQHRDYRRSSLWLSPTNRPSQWLLGRKPKKNQSCLQKEWEWVSIKNPKRYWFRKLMETHQAKLCTSRKEQHHGGPNCHQHQHTACVQGPRKGSLYRSASPTHFSFWRDKECEACDGYRLFPIQPRRQPWERERNALNGNNLKMLKTIGDGCDVPEKAISIHING